MDYQDYTPPSPGSIVTEPLQPNRANLILLLGLFSVLICGPLGFVTWFMANSDLRKIQQGIMSSDKIAFVKWGKIFGIAGIVFFTVTLAFAYIAVKKNIAEFPEMFQSKSLAPEFSSYVGDWKGSLGTTLTIRKDGRGDFKTKHKTVTNGKVEIKGDSLTIGLFGLSETWEIKEPPTLKEDSWNMRLNEETFTKKMSSSDQIVKIDLILCLHN